MATPLNVSQLFGAVEPIVRKHYGLEKNRYKAEFSQVFDTEKGKEAVRHAMEFGGPGALPQRNENDTVAGLNIKQGPDQSYVWTMFAGQMTLSWELVRDAKYKAIARVAGALGNAMALTPEYLAALYLDNAFSTSGSLSADGAAVYSTSHLIVQTQASNGANKLSTAAALSETSLEDSITALMTIKGPDGLITKVMPEKLVVPAALDITSRKLAQSDKTLGSANNDPSMVKSGRSGITPFTFRYLSSSTQWHIKTDRPNGLFWEWDVEEQFMEDNAPTSLQKIYIGFMRCRYGIDDWRGLFGSNPS